MYNEDKLDMIANELHEIVVELRNYNRIGTELLEIQRRMFTPTDMNVPHRVTSIGSDRDFYNRRQFERY